jgi:hypothetical protein
VLVRISEIVCDLQPTYPYPYPCTLVLGVLPELRALRPQIVHELVHFDI